MLTRRWKVVLALQARCSWLWLPRSILCTVHRRVVSCSLVSCSLDTTKAKAMWPWDKPDLLGELGKDIWLPIPACLFHRGRLIVAPCCTACHLLVAAKSPAHNGWPDPASGLSSARQPFSLCEAPTLNPRRHCSHTISSENMLPQQGNKKKKCISKDLKRWVQRNCSCSCCCVRACSQTSCCRLRHRRSPWCKTILTKPCCTAKLLWQQLWTVKEKQVQ